MAPESLGHYVVEKRGNEVCPGPPKVRTNIRVVEDLGPRWRREENVTRVSLR